MGEVHFYLIEIIVVVVVVIVDVDVIVIPSGSSYVGRVA